MENRETISNPITKGVIWRQLLNFFFPIIIGTFFQQLYNTADAVIVGRFLGKTALAAAGGSTAVLINLVVLFFINLSSGASVVISQFYGARKLKEMSDTIHTAIAMALVGGLLISVFGILLTPAVLRAMHTPSDVLPLAITYLQIYFGGMIAVLVYNVGTAILRAVGDSRRPLYFLIVACTINVVLDLLLVKVIPMGIAGASLATVLAQIISALLVIITLVRTKEAYKLTLRKIRFDFPILRRIIYIGFPAGVQSSMFQLSNILIQATLNGFGTDVVAGWTAFNKIDALYWMGSNAFGVSIMTFAGQNFGAGKFDRIRKSSRICLAMDAAYSIFLSVIMVVFGRVLLMMFSTDAVVISNGYQILLTMAPFYITYICVEIYSGTIRGVGNTVIPMLMTCFGICVLRVLWIFFWMPTHHTVRMLVTSYPLTWIFTSVLFVLYYFRGHWLRH